MNVLNAIWVDDGLCDGGEWRWRVVLLFTSNERTRLIAHGNAHAICCQKLTYENDEFNAHSVEEILLTVTSDGHTKFIPTERADWKTRGFAQLNKTNKTV